MRNLKDENRNILKSWSRGNVNVSVNDISVLFKNPLTNDEKMLLKLTRDKMKERNKTSKNKQSKPLGFLDAIAAASAF
jgi:ferredoxin-fold anticodon binding domain-containing protein